MQPSIVSAGTGFDGISSVNSFCGCLPPDGAVAAGPNHIVGAVNTAFEVWSKSGTPFAGYPKSLATLLTAPGCLSSISDPFAEYDPSSGRFILGALTYNGTTFDSAICVAVSQTGDPTALWSVYAFAASPAGRLLDFPHVAVGGGAIYLSANEFDNSGKTFVGARLYAYDKAAMYAGQPASFAFVDIGNNAAGNLADTLTPVRGAENAGAAYFIAADNTNCPCSSISIWEWTDPFGASTLSLQGGVTVTAYGQPPNAPQLGGHGQSGLITTNDAGNLGAYWYAGTIYGAHTLGFDPGSGAVAAVQWYQIGSPGGAPSLIQQGVVAANGQYRYFPDLTVDSAGNLAIAYAYSSSSDYAGIRYSGRAPGDPAGTLQAEGVVKAGEQTVNGSRYGDYAGESLDPDGCTIWHLEEYARSGVLWGTWVAPLISSNCTPAGTPTPTSTSTATATATATATPTRTATPTSTNTATPTSTNTATATTTDTPTATATPTCLIARADLNGDGEVNILDLTIEASVFLETVPPAPAQDDLNGDGQVNILDLTMMASVFLQSVSSCP